MDLHVGSLLMLKVAEQQLVDNDSIGGFQCDESFEDRGFNETPLHHQ
jgi:hypothetical protein